MSMVLTLFSALAAMIVVYGWLGQGGGVSGVILFGILLIGGIYRVFFAKPGDSRS